MCTKQMYRSVNHVFYVFPNFIDWLIAIDATHNPVRLVVFQDRHRHLMVNIKPFPQSFNGVICALH